MSAIPHSAFRIPHSPHPAALATVAPTEHHQRIATREWINCPECGKTFVAAAVVNGDVERVHRHHGYSGPIVTRRLFCDHCHLIARWDHACTVEGSLREEIGTYKIIRNVVTIERFLRDHPEAAGVEQR